MSGDPLELLGGRIELLATDPHLVRSRWVSLVGPLLRMVGWQPDFKADAASRLLAALRAEGRGSAPRTSAGGELAALLDGAIEELEANVTGAERACVVSGRVPTSRAAWLRRLYEVVARASRAVRDAADADERRLAAAIDPVMILPPLSLTTSREGKGAGEPGSSSPVLGAKEEAPGGRVAAAPGEVVPLTGAGPGGSAEALVELELAAIDHLLDAARAEAEFLGRRRRLLEAARKLLLDASAALPLDAAGVEARREHITSQIVRINRLEGAGLLPDIGLLHQTRTALGRGDRDKLTAALGAIERIALASGDAAAASRASAALRRLWGDRDPDGAPARDASRARSAAEVLGEKAMSSLQLAYREAREQLASSPVATRAKQRRQQEAAKAYFSSAGELAAVSAALSVDGCFEVGGVLSPVRVIEYEARLRVVSHPTQEMMLLPAQDLEDIPRAVIDDPRRILLSLAEGRLLTRKFIHVETVERSQTQLVGEARIYLLDGSDSMLTRGRVPGARARMRDAILLAELATLHRRLSERSRELRVVLYYRYFTRKLSPVTRVDSADGALRAMAEAIRTQRHGGTDIERALVASFRTVREAREADPDLSRAQIVLVTDGDAEVREQVVREHREKAGDLPIAVSVIALGEENDSLRSLVARQRARGERAFYHFISDEALAAIAGGELDDGPAIHLEAVPAADRAKSRSVLAAELEQQLGGLLDELGGLGQARHIDALEAAHAETEALEEIGVPGAVSEGRQARRELLDRDRRALEARYARWFPAPVASPAGAPPARGAPDGAPLPGTPERDLLEAVTVALVTVAEVLVEVGGSPLQRQADAVEIIERLLPDARLSPARYQAALRTYPAEVSRALRAVHAAVRPGSR